MAEVWICGRTHFHRRRRVAGVGRQAMKFKGALVAKTRLNATELFLRTSFRRSSPAPTRHRRHICERNTIKTCVCVGAHRLGRRRGGSGKSNITPHFAIGDSGRLFLNSALWIDFQRYCRTTLGEGLAQTTLLGWKTMKDVADIMNDVSVTVKFDPSTEARIFPLAHCNTGTSSTSQPSGR
jgi:hypothetical protein